MSFDLGEAAPSDYELATPMQHVMLDSLIQQRLQGHADEYQWRLGGGNKTTGDGLRALHYEPVQFINGEAVVPEAIVDDESHGVYTELAVDYPYDKHVRDKEHNYRQHGQGIRLVAYGGRFALAAVMTRDKPKIQEPMSKQTGEEAMKLIAQTERIVSWQGNSIVNEEQAMSMMLAAKSIAFAVLWGDAEGPEFNQNESQAAASKIANLCKSLATSIDVPGLVYDSQDEERVVIQSDPWKTGGLGKKVLSVISKRPNKHTWENGGEYLYIMEGGRTIYSKTYLPNGPYEKHGTGDNESTAKPATIRVATEKDLSSFLATMHSPIKTVQHPQS